MGLTFLVAPRFSGRFWLLDPLLGLVGASAAGYVAVFYPDLINELVYKPWQGVTVSLVIGLLSIEAVRRLTGPELTIIVVPICCPSACRSPSIGIGWPFTW